MEYKAPKIPEGINYSKEHPLKEFFLLLIGVALITVVIIIGLALGGRYLAGYIPFSAEQSVASNFTKELSQKENASEEHKKVLAYLQQLSGELAKAQKLPVDIKITVHYIEDDTVNAFATLGGHIFMFRGLLEKMPNENALAMVLAHEIAHIHHRHPIKSFGQAAVVGIALTVVSNSLGGSITDKALGEAGLFTALKFSRDQEYEADATALATLAAHYNHLNGANDLFDVLDHAHDIEMPELFSSHPQIENRMDVIKTMAKEKGWSIDGEFFSLPDHFKEWLKVKGAEN